MRDPLAFAAFYFVLYWYLQAQGARCVRIETNLLACFSPFLLERRTADRLSQSQAHPCQQCVWPAPTKNLDLFPRTSCASPAEQTRPHAPIPRPHYRGNGAEFISL
ncbi:uncharacterized protein QC761_0019020 [Podospora bellae-mahoneyi]|uniref:Secreted protein n=1 Tax=Podospora bellae-mahoneyi TaxID=2093777 RepID=A0ABR0G0J2_9PEZI|nr:hypothetical protein QC761_0019020 [Podospora bellae-mahoneyi]